jgi:class 3 adenylate cyclase/streptogramin lyase
MSGRSSQPDRFLATILFTDIAGSTDLAVQLGDRGWRRLLAQHNKVVRRRLREFGGRELDTAGDGFFCSFEQPAQAVRAADAIVRDAAALGLGVRAGIHTGECERVGTKVGGVAVHIAARVMAAAMPGTVLVSSTVHDLIAGSGLELTPAGTHKLKGVPGERALYQSARPVDKLADPRGVVDGMAAETMPRRRRRAAIVLAVAAIAIALVGVVALNGNFFGPPPSRAALSVGIDALGTIDAATGEISGVQQVPEGPASIALGQGRMWIGSVTRSVVTGLAISGTSPALTIGGAGRPSSIAIGDGNVWVADSYGQTISIVDAGNGDVVRSLGQAVRQVAYGLGSGWAVDDLHDLVVRMDSDDFQVVAPIALPAGSTPTAIALSADSVWVGDAGTSSVTRIDPATNAIAVGAIPLRVVPSAIATAGQDVWVASRESDSLLRLDPGANAVAMTVEHVCDQPTALLAVDGGVWLGCAGPRQLLHLDRDGMVLSTTQLGGEVTALARDPDTNRIYVTVRAP